MWKHKNFINLQLCAGEVDYNKHIFVNSSTEDTTITAYSASPTWEEVATSNTDKYTINGNNVVWNDGTILQYNNVDVLPTDEIVENGQYTTRSGATMKSYDLSTSTKWDSLSAGNHSVTIVAKASGYRDSASSTAVTVVKGSTSETWVLNETLTLTPNTFSANFTANNSTYTEIWMSDRELAYGDSGNVVYATKGGWIDEANKTITFATAPTGDLLTWLQSNGTKQ